MYPKTKQNITFEIRIILIDITNMHSHLCKTIFKDNFMRIQHILLCRLEKQTIFGFMKIPPFEKAPMRTLFSPEINSVHQQTAAEWHYQGIQVMLIQI